MKIKSFKYTLSNNLDVPFSEWSNQKHIITMIFDNIYDTIGPLNFFFYINTNTNLIFRVLEKCILHFSDARLRFRKFFFFFLQQ